MLYELSFILIAQPTSYDQILFLNLNYQIPELTNTWIDKYISNTWIDKYILICIHAVSKFGLDQVISHKLIESEWIPINN